MKKIFLILGSLLFTVIFLYSCNLGGGSGQAYTIKMRLIKGDTFSQDMQMNMLMNTSGLNMNMKMNAGYSFEVLNSDGPQNDIKLTYTKMQMTMDMGQLNNTIPDSIKNKSYDFIVGKSVVFKLSDDNEITGVTGFEQVINDPSHDSASIEMIKKMFSKDQFNSMFGMMFNMYPKKPVKVGESWKGETKVNMANMNMKIANKYSLLSVKNGLAEIDIDGIIGGAGDMIKESSGMKMDMKGTQKGKITIRMDNGYLHNSDYKMDFSVEMQMMGQKIPMTMKADCTIKGI